MHTVKRTQTIFGLSDRCMVESVRWKASVHAFQVYIVSSFRESPTNFVAMKYMSFRTANQPLHSYSRLLRRPQLSRGLEITYQGLNKTFSHCIRDHISASILETLLTQLPA